MKKYICVISCVLAACYVGADVILSNPESVPIENITISQLVTGGTTVQSRHTTVSDWKGLGQSFRWETEDDLDGIGLYMDSIQTAWGSDQQYVLVLQELDAYRGVPTATVYQVEFTMTAANVGASQWLYIDIDDQNLKSNQYYGFTLTPSADAISGHRLYWATSTTDTEYSAGSANLMDIVSRGLPPATTAYGSAGRDATFYMQTVVPEPATIGLFAISMCTVIGIRQFISK